MWLLGFDVVASDFIQKNLQVQWCWSLGQGFQFTKIILGHS
jgi:hypothetical protein